MKKLLFLAGVLVVFGACVNYDIPNSNGMWQLKTIEDAEHHVQVIDTIFYSFQRQSIFSYTILHEEENKAATSTVIYGFIDFPDNDHLHIQIDKGFFINKTTGDKYYSNLNLLLWKEEEITYEILKLKSKEMVLSHEGEIYHFIKF